MSLTKIHLPPKSTGTRHYQLNPTLNIESDNELRILFLRGYLKDEFSILDKQHVLQIIY